MAKVELAELQKTREQMSAERTKLAARLHAINTELDEIDPMQPAQAVIKMRELTGEREAFTALMEKLDERLGTTAKQVALLQEAERQKQVEALKPKLDAAEDAAVKALMAAIEAIDAADVVNREMRRLGGSGPVHFGSDLRHQLNYWLGRVAGTAGSAYTDRVAALRKRMTGPGALRV